MMKMLKTAAAAGLLALGLIAGPAQAGLTPITLNPSANDTGFESLTVCPPTICAGATLSGPVSYTVTFLTAGFFSSSITAAITDTGPPLSSFSVLNYDVVGAGQNVLGVTAAPNLAVTASTYTITIHYTFNGGPHASSAGFSQVLTTGATVVKVPEPGTAALFGLGLIAAAAIRRRKTR